MEDVIMQQIVNIIAKDENRREEEVYQDMCVAIDRSAGYLEYA